MGSIFRLVAKGLAAEKGLAATFDESALYASLAEQSCWAHALPRLGMSRFFGIFDRYVGHERYCWHERLFGLASCCADLGLIDRKRCTSGGKTTVAASSSAAAISTDPAPAAAVSSTAAKHQAWDIKRAHGNLVYHAFQIYANSENKSRQELIVAILALLRA